MGATLYQGEYVGGSGNTGSSFDQNGNPPSVKCSASDTRGMHIHFMFDNTSPESNSWAFGQTAPDDVALHSATTASLPQFHTDYSGNTPPGGYSDLSLDSFIRNSYVARFGLNYGSTKALNPSTFSICGVSSRWVVGCDFTYLGHSAGIAQTFESPEGYQKALMRRSGFTSVYSVQRDILCAYHSWSSFLGFPTGDESGTTTVTQFFEGGYIQKTQSPCATSVCNNSGVLQQSFSGVCN